jgi:hypothetical protein
MYRTYYSSNPFFYFRSCCRTLLYHLLLRSLAETPFLPSEYALRCYWLHINSASRKQQTQKELTFFDLLIDRLGLLA